MYLNRVLAWTWGLGVGAYRFFDSGLRVSDLGLGFCI